MAREILHSTRDNLTDLVGAHRELHDNPAVKAFFAFDEQEDTNFRRGRKAYYLDISVLDAQAAKLVAGLLQLYGSSPPPQDVAEFAKQLNDSIQEQRVSIFACKRPEADQGIRFSHIAGLTAAKGKLEQVFILPYLYPRLFSAESKGIMLYGPPGTGKTLLARAAIGELSNTAFFTASAAELLNKYVGDTEQNIQKLFNCAAEFVARKPARYRRSVIFLDELDALATSNTDSTAIVGAVRQLQTAMDGLKSISKVVVIGATNFPQRIDLPIRRRFSSFVFVDLPDYAARMSIILNRLSDAYSEPGTPDELRRISLEEDGPTEREMLWSDQTETVFGNINAEANPGSDSMDLKKVQLLAQKTGPKDTAEKRKQMNRPWTREFSKNAVTEYGFSAVDIENLANAAIANAALRVISDPIAKVLRRESHAPGGMKMDFFIYSPGHGELSIEDIMNQPIQPGVPPVNDRILNYNITMADFDLAFQEVRSTVNKKMYEDLLNWSPEVSE
jgi:SpoVK/Ycf46/Vps4 family AAA+-type ATPase